MKYMIRVFIAYTIAVALVFLPGCSKRESNLKSAAEKGILFVGNGSDPQDLDPSIVTGVPEQRLISALFEGLLALNPKNLKPEPGVAESWTVNSDGLEYIFHLRKDAKWSNGQPVTAKDFLYAYRRILSPNLGSQNAYMLYCMKNAEKYNKGVISDFSQVGVKTPDEYTLQITLNKATPYFLSLVTHMAWFPVNQSVIENFGKMDQRGTAWTMPEHMVCNGPFMLKEWHVNKVITVVKNPYYWDAANVKLNEIRFYPISDNQAEERSFRSGQLHITYTVPSSKIEYYQKKAPEILHITPYLGT